MGVIQKQAINTSIINWIGLALGIVNMIFIVPNVLEVYGIYYFISSAMLLLAPIIAVGMNFGVVKFYTDFDDGRETNRGILPLSLALVSIAFTIACIVVYFFKEPIIEYYKRTEPENYKYLIFAFPLLLFTALFNVVSAYVSNFKKITYPAIFRNSIKFILPILLFMVWQEWVSPMTFLWLIIFHSVLITVGMFWYLGKLGELKLKWQPSLLTAEKRAHMIPYLMNGILLSIGAVIAGLIDAVMVGSMIDMGATSAIYGIGSNIAGILIMPNSAVSGISSPIVSEHWKSNNMTAMQSIFQKSGMTLTIVGVLLFAGIWANLDEVFQLMKNGAVIGPQATMIILFLGLSRLISMSCGINGTIITLSHKYRVGTYSVLLLGLSNIVLNYFLIKKYGTSGAAMATGISVTLYNLFLAGYLYFQFRLFSFQFKMVEIYIIGFVLYYLSTYIDIGIPYINIVVKSAVVGIPFMVIIYGRKYSQDINNAVYDAFKKVGISLPKV